jgi:hypothetical protein
MARRWFRFNQGKQPLFEKSGAKTFLNLGHRI